MNTQRRVGFILVAALSGQAVFSSSVGQAAELPSQHHTDKSKNEEARKCNIAGSPGIVAGNGVCVKLSGYVTSQFGAGQLK